MMTNPTDLIPPGTLYPLVTCTLADLEERRPGSVRSLLCAPEFLAEFMQSQLIIGVDPTTGHEEVLYGVAAGRAALDKWRKTGEFEPVHYLKVPIDPETSDIEDLCNACLHLKGSYSGGARGNEIISPMLN